MKQVFFYVLVATSYQQPTSCHAINPQTNTVKRLYILFEKVFVLFFNAMSSNSNFFASYLGSHCNEVPLKRSFLFNGSKKLVPLSKGPTYPESQLSAVFLVKLGIKFKGPRKTVSVRKSPTCPGSHLMGVYCIIIYAQNEMQNKNTMIKNISNIPRN